MVEQPVVFDTPMVHAEISKVPVVPKVELDKVFTPVSNEKLEENFKKAISSNNENVEKNVVNDSKNIRGDIVVVPDRPVALNKKEDIEDFVVVDGGLSNEVQEESKVAYDELTGVTDEFSTNQDVMSDSNSDLNVINESPSAGENDFKVDYVNGNYDEPSSGLKENILKNLDSVVDSVNSKSSLEKLKDRISLLLKEKEAKSKELESARKKAEEAEKQREAARKAREDAIRSLDVYRQELENSVAMVAQQSDEIEKLAEATLTEAGMDLMVAEEASSLLDSVNGNEHIGGMRRAA